MKNLKRNILAFSLAFSLFFIVGSLSAQSETFVSKGAPMTNISSFEKQSIFDTWAQEGQIQLTIETDFSHLINTKNEDKYQRAKLTFDNGQGNVNTSDVKIKARGKYRRKICEFPPLKINFDKDDLKLTGLDTAFDKFKLVTHCTDSEDDEQNVLKEYLAYKLYNKLTPRSYEVKLVKVTYVDANGVEEALDRYAFLIENTKEMAARIGGEEIEGYNFSLDTLSNIDRQVFSLFQFMIGNTDWKTNMMHNVKIIQPADGKNLVMVPYDFDFAGLVNASYALPNADYGQTDVRQRIYMDKVDNLKKMGKVIHYFKIHKKALFEIVEQFEGLRKKNRRDVLKYLGSFYTTLENPKLSKEAFVKDSL